LFQNWIPVKSWSMVMNQTVKSTWSALKGIWTLMDQIWESVMPWKLPEKSI